MSFLKQSTFMKKNLTILSILLLPFFALGQGGISLSVLHDLKLGLGQDYNHNNGKSVLDVIVNLNLEGKQFEYYYFAVQVQFEKANLHGGDLDRYGVNAVWSFNQLIIPKLKVGVGAGFHIIDREHIGAVKTYSLLTEVSYPILKNISIISKSEWVRRRDLYTPKLGYNLSAGINYKF